MIGNKPRFISTPSRGRREHALRAIKDDIRERSEYTCAYCGNHGKQVEHVNPVSEQGVNDPRNLIIACSDCNQRKADRSVTEFLDENDDLGTTVDDLPIYGDLILNSTQLPEPYRQVRKETIEDFRRSGRFTGGNSSKDLEKAFRRNLWETEYGYWLCMKYPTDIKGISGMPGQRRVVFPLIHAIVEDPGCPVVNLLNSLTESASTRHLIDDIFIYRLHNGIPLADAIKKGIDVDDERVQAKIEEKRSKSGFESFSPQDFTVSDSLESVPVRRRQVILLNIHDFRRAGGHLRGTYDGFEIRVPEGDQGSDIPVLITKVRSEFAEAVPLSNGSWNSVDFDESKIGRILRKKTW